MAINLINGTYPPSVRSGGQTEQTTTTKSARLPAGGQIDKPVSEIDQVQLTPGSLSLRQLETETNEPPVDEAKVAALRKSIASGEYQVNSARVARKMFDLEDALFS